MNGNYEVKKRKQTGVMYLALLFFIAVIGLSLVLTGNYWGMAQKRQKEKELLFIGQQFRAAIKSYYKKSPGSVPQYPASLSELLLDHRFPNVQRHLRKIYRDPMTENTEWGLVLSPTGGIMGVHSLSLRKPIKRGLFLADNVGFNNALQYSNWVFTFTNDEQE